MTIRTTKPIQSRRQALSLLQRNFGDATMRYVRITSRDHRRIQVIAVESYTRAREELEFINEYEISREIFDWLKEERLIIGTPYWGGRNTWEFEPTQELAALAWSYERTPREPSEEDLSDVYGR